MKMSSEAEQEEWKDVPWLTSKRVQLAVLGFFGFINVYALRVNMSVAIVCMVNATAVNSNGDNTTNSQSDSSASSCGLLNSDLNQTSDEEFENGEFIWDKQTQGYILGAFFWGYLVTQIPGGWVATKFGGKQVFGISMLLATLVTFITPIAAQTSYIFLIVLRVVLGVCSGVTFPAMHALWGSWAPPMERSKLTAFTYAGAQLGNVITFPTSGMLCKYGFSGGWPSIFYILGKLITSQPIPTRMGDNSALRKDAVSNRAEPMSPVRTLRNLGLGSWYMRSSGSMGPYTLQILLCWWTLLYGKTLLNALKTIPAISHAQIARASKGGNAIVLRHFENIRIIDSIAEYFESSPDSSAQQLTSVCV